MSSEIVSALFDPTGNQARATAKWRIGSEATTPTQEELATLEPIAPKVERVSSLSSTIYQYVLGGLCSIFTGDNPTTREILAPLRMDQIVESVGSTRYETVVVFEDSFFGSMSRISSDALKTQAVEAVRRINRWLQITTGENASIIPVFTSDPGIEAGLQEAVRYLAEDVLKNPNFAKIDAAPILLMYTRFWPELLARLGFLESPANAIIVEPTIHFIDDRRLPTASLQTAYEDFLEWLQDNPYGPEASFNAGLGITGFTETYTSDQRKKRTRLLPYQDVPNTQNLAEWTTALEQAASEFPFPLNASLLYTQAVNFAYWSPVTTESLQSLITLQNAYYEAKKSVPKSARTKTRASELRNDFYAQAKPYLEILSSITRATLIQVLGEIK